MPESGGEGVILAAGGSSAGFALYVKDGHLVYHYNWFEEYRPQVVSSVPVPAGRSVVRMAFSYDGAEGELGKGGTVSLFIGDEEVGSVTLDRTVAARFGIDTFGVGEDSGAPVSTEYKPPFRFTGRIDEVIVDLESDRRSGCTWPESVEPRAGCPSRREFAGEADREGWKARLDDRLICRSSPDAPPPGSSGHRHRAALGG